MIRLMTAFCASFLVLITMPARDAALPCTITIAADGSGTVSCAGGAAPTPAPAPTPTPAPTPAPLPSSGSCYGGVRSMESAGTNLYAIAMPGQVICYAIPNTTPGGEVVNAGSVVFVPAPGRSAGGMSVEVALSPSPGDFSYWNSPAASFQFPHGGEVFHFCGITGGAESVTLSWAPTGQFTQCGKPAGAQWYMNIRYTGTTCPTNMNPPGCGMTFLWRRAY